ncbi:phd finger protein [Holotrichia oblita]|uniref:Phd finger protein n=1 Tax=Holotrichia oblita TaxID=644536 RepID=A0ACB9TF46_HOLOL|nr:phd finger protein [Holotrichia oblita]
MIGGNNQTTMISSEVSGTTLKIAYEKQTSAPSSLQVEHERVTPTPELPAKRSRSQSAEKIEKNTRTKKRGANSLNSHFNHVNITSKRSSRSQQSLENSQSASYTSLSQSQIKESPPSSPSSGSLGAAPSTGRKKGRKSAPASVSSSSSNKDIKDSIKLFQNGVHAPHMLGNQLNPNSNMAQKMSDHLNSELEAHSIFNSSENSSNLVGPPLQHRVIASARASQAGTSSSSSGSGLSSMLGGGGGSIPQTLDQLLERQWEQGSQFLMEQAQHFDIASLLSCLHQLRAENLRLEEHVSALLQRRDHLLAVNARLAIPLTGPPVPSQPNHPHTVNNIHPQVASSGHTESSRTRHVSYSSHSQGTPQPPIENGLPPDSYSHQHRSPATAPQPQPSPSQSVRHSPAGTASYSNSGLLRQNTTEPSGRSSSRSQPYPLSYQAPVSQQQVHLNYFTLNNFRKNPSTTLV